MWPDDIDLPVLVECAFGADPAADPGTWSWTDLSARLRADPIRIRAGRSGGARQVSPGTCTVTLDNDDSALTPLHPVSAYWPAVELGTPLRVSVQWAGVWHVRFAGFADQWEPTYVPTGVIGQMSSAVRVTCSGILRRLGQGEQPAESALRRSIRASGPLAYYPIEDGVAATQAGSAVGGGELQVTGTAEFKPVDNYVTFAGNITRYGTSSLVDLAAGGRLDVILPPAVPAGTGTRWTVHVAARVDVTTTAADVVLMEWTTPGGTYARWRLVSTTLSRSQVIGYSAAGAASLIVDVGSAINTFTVHAVSARQVGATIVVDLARSDVTVSTATVPGTLSGITSMSVNPTQATASSEMPFGHLAIWAATAVPYRIGVVNEAGVLVREARRAYERESATTRLARLCAEDGIALTMPTVPVDALQRMGWQEPGTAAELRQDCVDVDGGVLYEDGFGLGYLPRSSRYNAVPALTVDLATYAVTGRPAVLEATYDDQDIRNRWTVERREGSFAVAEDVVSQRRGVYADSIELPLATDDQLAGQAGWRLHLTTAVDLREDNIPIDLAANPGLIDGWLACQVGSRIVRTNPPAQHRPGPLDRIVEGWTETLGPRSWQVAVVPSLATPWDVAVVDAVGQVAGDGATLAASVTATATTLSLATPAAMGLWTTLPAAMPLDLVVGGERVTVTAIVGTSSPQTATVVRSVDGVIKAHSAGTPVDVWQPAVVAL